MFDHASNRTSLIRSETPLNTGYTPDHPVNRKKELDQIIDAIRPLTDRREPDNLLLFGPAGTGKTTLVNHVLCNLAEETRITTAYINCWQYNTRSSLLTELLIQLGYPAPRKGKPVDELLARLREWVDKHHGAVVALDEFDQLSDQAAVAYDLQEVSDTADHSLGLLLVSNQPPAQLELGPRSQSRLAYQPLAVRPYTEQDLAAILCHRADQAFSPDTVTDDAIDRIATTVAAQNGDCREALAILLRAGRLAEQDNAERSRSSMSSRLEVRNEASLTAVTSQFPKYARRMASPRYLCYPSDDWR